MFKLSHQHLDQSQEQNRTPWTNDVDDHTSTNRKNGIAEGWISESRLIDESVYRAQEEENIQKVLLPRY